AEFCHIHRSSDLGVCGAQYPARLAGVAAARRCIGSLGCAAGRRCCMSRADVEEMMDEPKGAFRQAMAWLHTWGGLLAGWVLFAIYTAAVIWVFAVRNIRRAWLGLLLPAAVLAALGALLAGGAA